ncbi:MAG: GGDEF domain-containing protein [Solirubrobacteraceae bacterium]
MGVGVNVIGAGRRPDGARYGAVDGAVPARATLILYAVCCFAVLAVLTVGGSLRWSEITLSLLLQAVVGLLLLADIRGRRDGSERIRAIGVCGVVAYLIAVALMRDASGAGAGFGPLVLLPVAWSSLRARRTELAVAVLGAALVYLAPILMIGAPRYPASGLRAGLLFLVISGGLGITVMHLVRRVERLIKQLSSLARTDELTGLANRRAWTDLLGRELSLSRRSGQALVVALIDLDFFKEYNDSHGHLAADRLLRAATAAWGATLRDTDVLARWGGDEFALLLPSCDAACAALVVERLRASCPEAQFSAGVAQADADSTPESIIAAADAAVYEAKRTGRSSTSLAGRRGNKQSAPSASPPRVLR